MNQRCNRFARFRASLSCRLCRSSSARAAWDALAGSHPEATLYHRGPWLEVLRRAFGVRPSVAMHRRCRFDAGRMPARPGRQSNSPQSDLAALLGFLSAAGRGRFSPRFPADRDWLAILKSRSTARDTRRRRILIRGRCSITSSAGRSICRSPFQAIERAADREVRRHLRRAREAGVSGRLFAAAPRRSKASSGSSLIAGAVSECRRSRSSFSGQCTRSSRNAIRSTCCSRCTRASASLPVVVLRDGNDLHAKWSARAAGGPDGSSHLIFMSIAEQAR